MTEQDFQNEYQHGYDVGKHHGFTEGRKQGYLDALAEVSDEVWKRIHAAKREDGTDASSSQDQSH